MPQQSSIEELQLNAKEVFAAAKKGELKKITLGLIGPEEAAKIKAKANVDTLLCKREFTSRWIEHGIERHGNEKALGQKDITEQDFKRYVEIIRDPHNIEPGTTPGGIYYSRRYPDGTVYMVEQKVKGTKLEFRTLWKKEYGGVMVPILAVGGFEEDEE